MSKGQEAGRLQLYIDVNAHLEFGSSITEYVVVGSRARTTLRHHQVLPSRPQILESNSRL